MGPAPHDRWHGKWRLGGKSITFLPSVHSSVPYSHVSLFIAAGELNFSERATFHPSFLFSFSISLSRTSRTRCMLSPLKGMQMQDHGRVNLTWVASMPGGEVFVKPVVCLLDEPGSDSSGTTP